MSTSQYELELFKQTLDQVKDRKPLLIDQIVPYYERYYQTVLTHNPIISEDWGKFNTRHGAKSIRGTTSELLTVTALTLPRFGVDEVIQIEDKTEQKYGSDIKVRKKNKTFTISVKTCKPRNVFVEGKLETHIQVWNDWFEPAVWRVDFLAAVYPESKRVWLFSYGTLANIHCTLNEQGFFKPTSTAASVPFSITTFEQKFPNGLIYFDLTKDKEWTTDQ